MLAASPTVHQSKESPKTARSTPMSSCTTSLTLSISSSSSCKRPQTQSPLVNCQGTFSFAPIGTYLEYRNFLKYEASLQLTVCWSFQIPHGQGHPRFQSRGYGCLCHIHQLQVRRAFTFSS